MKFASSTRVKAPNSKNTTSGDGLYDLASSKLPRRGMVDDKEVEGGSQKETKNSQSVSRGKKRLTYVDTLRKDTELDCVDEIGGLMNNRCLWRTAIDTRTLQPP